MNISILNEEKTRKNLTYKDISERAKIPEDTVKNILTGKTKRPRIDTLEPIIEAIGLPYHKVFDLVDTCDDTKTELQKVDNGNSPCSAAVANLKELYETQLQLIKDSNQTHITNIRSHYEAQIADLKDNHEKLQEHYERRLADKRELIDRVEKHLETVSKEKQWFKIGFAISVFLFGVLCVAELMNPNLGWLRFK